MNRYFAFACALLLSLVTVSATVTAAPSDWMSFHLSSARSGGD